MNIGISRTSAIIVVVMALVSNACDSKSIQERSIYEQQPKSDKPSGTENLYLKKWTGKPALYKLSDNLILQIPPIYQGFWGQGDKVIRPPFNLNDLRTVSSVGFAFFMPGFSGYTPENYEKDFDEDKVQVISLAHVGMGAEQPDAVGFYPPNMFQRVIASARPLYDPQNYKDRFGLRCFDPRVNKDLDTACYGIRDDKHDEYILLDIMNPPYESWIKYPSMVARYFTPQYGGVEIVWQAHMKHFARWRDIDSQIWKFVDAWNISSSRKSIQK